MTGSKPNFNELITQRMMGESPTDRFTHVDVGDADRVPIWTAWIFQSVMTIMTAMLR